MLGVEWVVNKCPDEEHFRKPLPPPLDYPSPVDTPDTAMYKRWHSKEGRQNYDTGLFTDIGYDIVGGKKVYKKFAGVNQPMEWH